MGEVGGGGRGLRGGGLRMEPTSRALGEEGRVRRRRGGCAGNINQFFLNNSTRGNMPPKCHFSQTLDEPLYGIKL
jgi:hypothetical protein